ncbi:Metabotropic glutamate receptor-like protein [Trichinella pseudospiralis]
MASIRATMTMTVGQNRMDNQERAENFDPNRPNLNFNAINEFYISLHIPIRQMDCQRRWLNGIYNVKLVNSLMKKALREITAPMMT